MEVSPDYTAHEYRQKIDLHLEDLQTRAKAAGIDYFLVDTSQPLDAALRESTWLFGKARCSYGFLRTAWFLAGLAAVGLPVWIHPAQAP